MNGWIEDVILLGLGFLLLLNGWLIPWVATGFLFLCIVAHIREAYLKFLDKNLKESQNKEGSQTAPDRGNENKSKIFGMKPRSWTIIRG